MPQLTLYYATGSCALIPHALLHHLSLPTTFTKVTRGPHGYEAADGSFTNAEYRLIHPNGYVPALTADGENITEMPALLTHIALQAPDAELLGSTPLQRVRVAEWLAWLAGSLHGNAFAMVFRPGRFSDDEGTHASIREKGIKSVKQGFERVERGLRAGKWAVGEAVTVVDFNLYIFARWGKEMGLDVQRDYPGYSEFAGRVEGLEGVRKAVAEHEKELLFSASN